MPAVTAGQRDRVRGSRVQVCWLRRYGRRSPPRSAVIWISGYSALRLMPCGTNLHAGAAVAWAEP